jgi:hypothetical protein
MSTPAPGTNPTAVLGGGLGGIATTPGGTVGGGVVIGCNIAQPIMGGVFQQNPPTGEWVAWTGGKPLRNWTSLDQRNQRQHLPRPCIAVPG